jgi:uncharacterized membrane protein YqjE
MDSREKPPSGLKSEATSFMRDASAYLRLRSELFSIEAKEAGQVYGKKSALLVIGGGLILLSYLLLLAALIGLIAAALDPDSQISLMNWIGSSLIFSAVHLIIGFILLKKGKKIGAEQKLFEYTRNELQQEQQWLKHTKKP